MPRCNTNTTLSRRTRVSASRVTVLTIIDHLEKTIAKLCEKDLEKDAAKDWSKDVEGMQITKDDNNDIFIGISFCSGLDLE